MSEKLIKKRERGANYTPEEKAMLADIITQYKYVVEDKRTGGHILNKKKEAWNAITIKYNSNCTTGSRQMDQLKALYDNMKQKSRKHVGESNKLEYINRQSTSKQHEIVTKDDLAKALKHVKEDKVQIHKTGGGSWKPMVTDSDTKILAIIQEQIEPLSNPYDSGAVYFKDTDHINHSETIEVDSEPSAFEIIEAIETSVDVNYGEMDISSPLQEETEIHTTAQDQSDQNPKLVKRHTRVVSPTRKKFVKTKDVAKVQKKLKKPKSAEALKRIYFKKKCENAYLERKKLMQEILNSKREHNLKMMILKKKLEKINK